MTYDTKEAIRAKTQKAANKAAGPCPNCGAAADVDLIDASQFGSPPHFIAGAVNCSARCYERDPDSYLAAVKASTHPEPRR